MGRQKNPTTADQNVSAIRDLAMMLDCAIADGARLRLPMFVWLLRLARVELINSTEGDHQMMENTLREVG